MATADALRLADPDRVGASDSGPFLADVIIERVAEEAAAARRVRRRRVVFASLAAAAAAVIVVVALAFGFDSDDDDDSPTTVELAGDAGVTASAALDGRAWGTEITLEVDGLDDGEIYWLWLTGADGERFVAGSLTGTGRTAHAVLASALPAEDARRIWMTDEDDQVVLDATLDAP